MKEETFEKAVVNYLKLSGNPDTAINRLEAKTEITKHLLSREALDTAIREDYDE